MYVIFPIIFSFFFFIFIYVGAYFIVYHILHLENNSAYERVLLTESC